MKIGKRVVRGGENRPAVNWETDSVWLRRVVWGRKI